MSSAGRGGKSSSDDWTSAWKIAKDGDYGGLHALCGPLFLSIARVVASQCVEDAVQEALTKVWRNLHRVDGERPETIKQVITRIGVNAMRDEVRRVLRRKDKPTAEIEKESPRVGDALPDFPLVQRVLEYIRERGSAEGVFLSVGRDVGMTAAEVRSDLKVMLAEYEVKHGKSDADILRSIRNGSKPVNRGSVDPPVRGDVDPHRTGAGDGRGGSGGLGKEGRRKVDRSKGQHGKRDRR